MCMRSSLVLAAFLLAPPLGADEPKPTPDRVRSAVEKALPLIQKGAVGHREQRTCFACHNQGVPMLALTTARSRGFDVAADEMRKQLEFIDAFLAKNRDNYLKGRGQGGQADTAGSALWTLELGGAKANPTTAAVAEYLLQHHKDLDYWRATSNRPPSEASPFTTSYVALRGLQTFGTEEQKERIEARFEKVRDWLVRTPAKDTEDRVFRLWALKIADADVEEIETAARDLLKRQHPEGGWAQLDSMKPDAYATGSALVVLHETGQLSAIDPAYQKGMAFLLKTQREDGSWFVKSRSKPFQTYFESGFPHGPDQFISIAASSWATTALALSLPPKKGE